VLNAANETAVAAFLAGGIRFLDIPRLLGRVLDAHVPAPATELAALLRADRWARESAHALLDAATRSRRRPRDEVPGRAGHVQALFAVRRVVATSAGRDVWTSLS